MSTADTYVRARIDSATKERAADTLAAMGLSISDAIRLLMLRIVDERRLPFEVKSPNASTRKAIAQLETGKGKRFTSIEALIADLNADDRANHQRLSATTGGQEPIHATLET
jgi:DNA-damage-inducible protein J